MVTSKPSLRAQAYDRIQEMLAADQLPVGAHLSTQLLTQRLGLGRTPVREAVNQLEAEGLLEQVPKIGIVIKPLRWNDVVVLLDLRRVHECYAVKRAARRITPAQLDRMRDNCRELAQLARRARAQGFVNIRDEMGMGVERADIAFHELILEAASSRMLSRLMRENRLLRRRLRFQSNYHLQSVAKTLIQHWRIYQALRRGDARAARRLMALHVTTREYRRAFALQSELAV